MISFLCITVRFLQPYSHGRGDGGEPEWPPSPLRVFQALVAASAARWNERMQLSYAVPALEWLEQQPTPTIAAVCGSPSGNPYLLYIPNNATELLVPAWRKGDTGKAVKREQKVVRPTQLSGEEVHYLYALSNDISEFEKHRGTLRDAARSVTHLGWGVDMVAANATVISEEEAAKLPGEAWRPSPDSQTQGLRVPISGTLDALISKHKAFLNRLGKNGVSFKPVPPLSAFRVVGYRRDRNPVKRPFAAFSILKLDGSGFRPFDAMRWGRCVAGLLRHATHIAAENSGENSGWTKEKIDSFVLGHGENLGEEHKPIGPKRFAYLPLPSIEHRGDAGRVVTSIRRALLTVPGNGGHSEIAWARRQLSGIELVAEQNGKLAAARGTSDYGVQEPVALLSLLPESDTGVVPYIKASAEWTTVTPVALPGCDEGKAAKTDKLLEKMFRHAGYSRDAVAELDFHRVPFLRGADDAIRYRPKPPHYLANCTMYHMRIRWKYPMPGPIVLGSGRYCGLGLFAATS